MLHARESSPPGVLFDCFAPPVIYTPPVVYVPPAAYAAQPSVAYLAYSEPVMPPPPPAEPSPEPPAVAPTVPVAPTPTAEIYRWTDEQGVANWTDRLDKIPERHRRVARRIS